MIPRARNRAPFGPILACVLLGFGAPIAAGPDPNPTTEATRPRAGLPCGSLEAVDAYVGSYREMAAFDGVVLIAEGDSIVYLCAYGLADYRFQTPVTPATRFRIASLSKQFTDVAIGRLIDSGRVAMDAPLAEYLPDFPNAGRITVRHLVEHTSGVQHTNDLEWMDMGTPFALDQIVARLAEEPLAFEPGTDSDYSNGGYALLAAVTEAVTGRPFGEHLAAEFAERGFPSVGHETPFAVIPGMAHRYAPGPVHGERVEAPVYLVANRIGGGSMYAAAEDVWRFFRAAYAGDLLAPSTTADLFPRPADGDVLITGRSPGTLAQVYMNFDSGLSVVTLSSNSAWPGSFNPDLVALYRNEDASLTAFELDPTPVDPAAAARHSGVFEAERFGWVVEVRPGDAGLEFLQEGVPTALARTRSGAFHLPLYDWLCDFEVDGSGFTCRQRDPDAEIRFVFRRVPGPDSAP